MTALVAAAWCAVGLVWGLLLGFRWGRRIDRRYVERVEQFEKRLDAVVAALRKHEERAATDGTEPPG